MKNLPEAISGWIGDAELTDTSGWSGDKTYFVDRDCGAYLKIGPKGKFAKAARMQEYWAGKGLSAKVIIYLSDEWDYLITASVPGKNGIDKACLDDPERLSRIFGESLRKLHDTDFSDCPVEINPVLLEMAEKGSFSKTHLASMSCYIGDVSPEIAAREIKNGAALLRTDALVHGDYCLPNIMLDNWQLTGFIDIADSGAGDRHYDIAWGVWTILFNLKDKKYAEMFMDAYGREMIDADRLRICMYLSAM